MIEIIRDSERTGDDVKKTVVEFVDAIEGGLDVLERDFMLDDETCIDFLARDVDGKPVVLLMGDEEQKGELISRLLLVLQRLKKNRFFLVRIFKEPNFDFSVPPRVFLLMPKVSDEFVESLEYIQGCEIFPCEYSYLTLEERVR